MQLVCCTSRWVIAHSLMCTLYCFCQCGSWLCRCSVSLSRCIECITESPYSVHGTQHEPSASTSDGAFHSSVNTGRRNMSALMHWMWYASVLDDESLQCGIWPFPAMYRPALLALNATVLLTLGVRRGMYPQRLAGAAHLPPLLTYISLVVCATSWRWAVTPYLPFRVGNICQQVCLDFAFDDC